MTGTGDRPHRAPRGSRPAELHGHRDVDNYAWMRDHDAPALRDYLAAERAYYDAQTPAPGRADRRAVRRGGGPHAGRGGGLGQLDAARLPVLAPDAGRGAEDRQLLRAPAWPVRRAGRVLLDENVLGAATGYVDVGVAEPSPDDRLLAWSADTSGAEIYQLRFTEIATGRELPDVIERSYPGGAWSSDCAHFFYLVPDELNRPYQVWRHALGTPAAEDELVYEETDARFELTLAASRSGELIVITAASRIPPRFA